MRLISAMTCTTAAFGAALILPAMASATDVHCATDGGADVTVIDGSTACRAAAESLGRAQAAGYDGVGYARAGLGAAAFGIGAAGGVGASDGVGGIPIALGYGADAVALTSIAAPATDSDTGHPSPPIPLFAVSIAFDGSRAQVATADSTVVCLGAAAFAWNSATGATCLTTPFGRWQTPRSELG
ncbi:hypothetical protein OG563_19330 [Nocardia vinacea]|uniref:Secreted protein n=1 Tax=Nocardia vinacea TaxID=96468 RepID=A0ABZ1Z4F5_9NOCA|nr:DUF6764 family protein [Nocardia vinacea]